jgi:hypothetical protein
MPSTQTELASDTRFPPMLNNGEHHSFVARNLNWQLRNGKQRVRICGLPASPLPGSRLIPGLGVALLALGGSLVGALGSHWGGYRLAFNTHWGGLDVACLWLCAAFYFLLSAFRFSGSVAFFILHSSLRSAATEDGSAFCIRPEVALGGFDPVQLNSEDAKARGRRIRQGPPFHQSRPFPTPDISHP